MIDLHPLRPWPYERLCHEGVNGLAFSTAWQAKRDHSVGVSGSPAPGQWPPGPSAPNLSVLGRKVQPIAPRDLFHVHEQKHTTVDE